MKELGRNKKEGINCNGLFTIQVSRKTGAPSLGANKWDSTQRWIFSHSGVTEKRSAWFEVLPKPRMQVNRKGLRGGAPDQKRLTATSHPPGARMQMALAEKYYIGKAILVSQAGTHKEALFHWHIFCSKSSCSNLARYKWAFLQHSLNRSPISRECVIPKVQHAQFSCNKRKVGVIAPL